MNRFTKGLALALTIFGFSTTDTFAQVSATATATATVVTPIQITKQVDINFGTLAVSATGGTVILTPAGGRSTTSGVVLPATASTITAASFDITGQPNYTYAITLPSTATILTRNTGTETMSVGTFTSTPSLTGTLDGSGNQPLKVGATLTVGSLQAAGVYVSGTPFTVIVNYN
jgi:hypothetical protein